MDTFQVVDMPHEAKVGGGVWHEYILLLKKKKNMILLYHSLARAVGWDRRRASEWQNECHTAAAA